MGAPGHGEVLVRMGVGGICGSDIHYFQDGCIGEIKVREPIVLGHEVAGTIEELGADVAGLKIGDRVALNPSLPCGVCKFCSADLFQHCLRIRFFGSAARFPHVQGAFCELMVVSASQCLRFGEKTSFAEAACAEPLAVCLHASKQAPDLEGKKILVTGAGPIGALCVAVAKWKGATDIVATDIENFALSVASKMGATHTINVATNESELEPYLVDKGFFDVVFECSAAAAALRLAIAATRPRGTIVQIGVTDQLPVPANQFVVKEIGLLGSYRFHAEYQEALNAIVQDKIDVNPIITATYPLSQALAAFQEAGTPGKSVKVQLDFSTT